MRLKINIMDISTSGEMMTVKVDARNPLFITNGATLASVNGRLRAVHRQFFNVEEPLMYTITVLSKNGINLPDCDIVGQACGDLVICLEPDNRVFDDLYFVFSYNFDVVDYMFSCFCKIMRTDEVELYLKTIK